MYSTFELQQIKDGVKFGWKLVSYALIWLCDVTEPYNSEQLTELKAMTVILK